MSEEENIVEERIGGYKFWIIIGILLLLVFLSIFRGGTDNNSKTLPNINLGRNGQITIEDPKTGLPRKLEPCGDKCEVQKGTNSKVTNVTSITIIRSQEGENTLCCYAAFGSGPDQEICIEKPPELPSCP